MGNLYKEIKGAQVSCRMLSRGCESSKIKASILTTLLGEIDTQTTGTDKSITDELILQTIKKFIKNNDETMNRCTDSGVLFKLTVENNCLQTFIPKQFNEDELRGVIKLIIATQDTCTIGSVMAELKSKYAGQYDGKLASQIIKEEI